MKGRHITALVVAGILSAASVMAYFSFGPSLFNSLIVDKNGRIGTQSASLIGALNTDGYAYSDSGYGTSIRDNTGNVTDYDVLTLTADSATCIGNCEKEESREVVTETVTSNGSEETNTQEILVEEQELKNETAPSSEAATSSELMREQAIDTEEDTVIKTETEETDDTREEPVSRSGGSRRSSNGTDTDTESNSETDEESETASSTASSTESDMSGDEVLADTSSSSEVIDTDPEASPIEQFLSALEKVVTVFEGKIGINTLIPRFSLDVSGFVYASKGFLIGEPEQPTGLVVTERGICIGACGIGLPFAQDDTDNSSEGAEDDASENSSDDRSEETIANRTEESKDQETVASSSDSTLIEQDPQTSSTTNDSANDSANPNEEILSITTNPLPDTLETEIRTAIETRENISQSTSTTEIVSLPEDIHATTSQVVDTSPVSTSTPSDETVQ